MANGIDTGREGGLPLAEAAARLGVSREALRKRIKRGTVKSYTANGRLYAVLDAPPETGHAGIDAGGTAAVDVAALRAEVDKLTALLAEVSGERDYLRQAHAAALSRIPAQITSEAESLRGRPWWRRWIPRQ